MCGVVESARPRSALEPSVLANDGPLTIRAHWESVQCLAPFRNYHIRRLVEPKKGENIGLSVHTEFSKNCDQWQQLL